MFPVCALYALFIWLSDGCMFLPCKVIVSKLFTFNERLEALRSTNYAQCAQFCSRQRPSYFIFSQASASRHADGDQVSFGKCWKGVGSRREPLLGDKYDILWNDFTDTVPDCTRLYPKWGFVSGSWTVKAAMVFKTFQDAARTTTKIILWLPDKTPTKKKV